ncbi:hypothetical protein CPTB_01196 [Corynebacterium pseudotuberculosis]|nr:Hypothetical protein Cp3995_1993 [Corynebacterium pseudotuberculosis 3/99-5]AIG06162.1 hypothetical protein CPTA_00333 [Corynebacterium pseudotuberculosis]AIG09252.1 hypothetical protein CPTB_01196 [Corynebacterium pseudotuberculosis]AIG11153.1 hypothetical protein CPTC_00865 [Corynebacterium pseudotuberculosis]AKC74709.1 Hypothetical protein Cp226_2021 [Corynebacterium pseudotuberculosis]
MMDSKDTGVNTAGTGIRNTLFARSEKHARRAPIFAFVAAAVLFIVAAAGPALMISRIKPIPVDTTRQITTTPAATTLYDPEAPCPPDAPQSCFVVNTTTQLHREIKTVKTDVRDEVDLHVTDNLVRTDTQKSIVDIDDKLRLIRHSTYPVLDFASHMKVMAPSLNLSFDTGDFARDGLQYFYPFHTERRSYQFFDPIAQKPWPLDYVEEKNGIYMFTQDIPATDLAKAATRSFTQPEDISDEPSMEATTSDLSKEQQDHVHKMHITAPASKFYGEGRAGTVKLTPYYTVKRTLWVEPKSGVVVNQSEDVFMFYATDQQDADATAQRGHDPMRTILKTKLQWDATTQAHAHDEAQPTVDTLHRLRIGGFVAKMLGFALLVVGLWLAVRRPHDVSTHAS